MWTLGGAALWWRCECLWNETILNVCGKDVQEDCRIEESSGEVSSTTIGHLKY